MEIEQNHIINELNMSVLKTLVVDDCKLNCLVISMLLQKLDLKVDMAYDGQSAIENIASTEYDFIWIDVTMPGLDGYETTDIIRKKLNFDKIIIGITSHADEETKEKCIAAGMNDVIFKPVTKDILKQKIEEFTLKE